MQRAIIRQGREYARRNHSPTPLMWQWHGEYLGAAHGVSGILQALLSHYDLLDEGERVDVRRTLDWLVSIQTEDGNFPSSVKHIGSFHILTQWSFLLISRVGSSGENRHELVHWCHGAGGVIFLLVTAALVFKHRSQPDYDRYTQAARRCGDLIWQRGVLRKGPGICHGVAGGGYAFLALYRLTREERYLQWARLFAAVMMDPQFEVSLLGGCWWSRCYETPIRSVFRRRPTPPTRHGASTKGGLAPCASSPT